MASSFTVSSTGGISASGGGLTTSGVAIVSPVEEGSPSSCATNMFVNDVTPTIKRATITYCRKNEGEHFCFVM
jgi:hypothetical protein